jgi:ABC-type dipeptide/oligopeptide/nickel transport system permease component
MLTFLGRRFFQLIPTLIGVALVTFFLMRMIPGDPTTMTGDTISEEVRARLRAEWHLDKPWYVQFWYFAKGLPTLDLGVSMKDGTPVRQLIGEYFVRTLQLGLAAFLLSVSLGVTLGITAALFQGTWIDKSILVVSLVGISTPVFVGGIGLIIVAGFLKFPYTMATSMDGFDPRYLVLPAATLGLRSVAYLARMTRAAVVEVGTMDYLRTARAKGLHPTTIIFRHQLKNAMIPIITVVGLNFADFLTGAIITETVFQWPGLGFLIKTSLAFRDLPVVMGTVLFTTVLFVTINFLVDALYAWFDPRIRLS